MVIDDILIKNKITYKRFKYYKNRTNSFWFLLPILKLNRETLTKDYNLYNVFLGNHIIEKQYGNSLHLLFDTINKSKKDIRLFLEKAKSHPYFLDIYDCEGDYPVGVVFELDPKFDEVLKIFKNGEYSKFPEWFKNKYFNKNNQQWKIFNKHEDFRKLIERKVGERISQDAEVWHKPSIETEIYMYNKNVIEDSWQI